MRVGRGAVRVPAAFLPQIAHEIVQVRFAQGIFVGGHPRSAVADLRLHGVVVHRLAGDQCGALVKAGEPRNVLGELVVAEPAFVIVDLAPALRAALGGLPEFENLQ